METLTFRIENGPGNGALSSVFVLTNALSLKGSVTASPSEKLSLTGAILWAKKDEQGRADSDEMGWEADIIATYNLYDNVAFTAGFGYLWAGDFYGADADDPLGLMAQTEIKF